jgi:hypothetical protein
LDLADQIRQRRRDAEAADRAAIGRDDAKRLFATKEPAALRELTAAWIEANSLAVAGKILPVGDELALLWQRLGAIADGEPPALTSMLAGSHKLVEEDDFALSVIRPDLIGIAAGVLTKFVAAENAENQAALARFQQFFATAAENREAVAIVRCTTGSPS